jgi:cullin-4
MKKVGSGCKIVIKPLKVQPKLPDNFEEDSWNKLKAAVQAIHKKIYISLSKEELCQVPVLIYRLILDNI